MFVVHGHDDTVKDAVAHLLDRLGLDAIVLHDKPNQGRTVIEEFERHADVGFAVVLLTPDDFGYPAEKPSNGRPRARQDVILEPGYFVARLGRSHVCALHQG